MQNRESKRSRHPAVCRIFTLAAFGVLAVCAQAVPRGAQLQAADGILGSTAILPVPAQPKFATQVGDGVFAYLIGLLDHNEYGAVSGEHLKQVLRESGRSSRVPEERVVEFRRAPIPGGGAWVRAVFDRPLGVPVPYQLLGYHPGSLVTSQAATFEEIHFPQLAIPNPNPSGPTMITIHDVYLWSMVDGKILIDIDRVVDAILGAKIDDTYIVALAVFRYRSDRFAMALGFNNEGEGRSGALDLHADKVRFPSSEELKVVGRHLRSRAIARLAQMGIPAWVPPDRRK